jgi:hypothetical protein
MGGVLMTQRAFAKYIGRSVGYVNKMVKSGVIPLHGPKKRIDPEEAKAAIEAVKDPAREPQRQANERRRQQPGIFDEDMLPKKSLADMTPEERAEYDRRIAEERKHLEDLRREAQEKGVELPADPGDMTLNEVKVFKEFFQGRLAQLEFRKKNAELIEVEVVQREAFEEARRVKDALLSLPHKLSVRLVGKGDPKEIETILDVEFRQILEELSGGVAMRQ